MSANDGRVIGTTKIVDHGPDNLRWNLVIVGDGYQESELLTYRQNVENFLATFQITPPFDFLFRGINVHRVDVVSTQSGARDPIDCPGGTGASPRTFFDATYCSVFGNQRLDRLLTINSPLALSVATNQVTRRHQVLCVVNSSKYGGSGGQVATFSTHPQSGQIAIHEMGHSAFGLADEYGGDGSATPFGEPPKPNVTRDTNRNTNKWGALIAPTTPMPSQCNPSCIASQCIPPDLPVPPNTVGAYEGGMYSDCNVYRPFSKCYMLTLGDPFCPVCSGIIQRTLQPFVPADG